MKFKDYFKLNLKSKENLYGYIFILPFIIGFIFFFLYPFLQAIIFSISKLKITSSGYETISVGLENYREALFVNADYVRNLVSVFGQMFAEVPVIIMFSFFAAVLLNQKFRGRWLARLLFFLPVILGSGVILRMEQWDVMHSFLETAGMGAVEEGGLFGPSVQTILIELNFPAKFVDFIVENVSQIPDILRASAVQIIVFLAGLQSIPSSLYEASKMEGASGWENFWLITFPLVSPLILTNIVYTVVDSFTAVDNEIVIMISEGAFGRLGFGQSTAMAMMYFAVIILLLGILIKVISRGVFYQE